MLKLKRATKQITFKLLIFFTATTLLPLLGISAFLRNDIENQLLSYLDKEMAQYEKHLFYNLEQFKEYFNLIALDYTLWDDAYQKVNEQDLHWITTNMVPWISDGFDFTYSAITTSSGELLIESDGGFYQENFLHLSYGLISDTPSYIMINGDIYFAVYKNILDNEDNPFPAGKLLLIEKLDEDFIEKNLKLPEVSTYLYINKQLSTNEPLLEDYLKEQSTFPSEPYLINEYLFTFIPIKSASGEVMFYAINKIPYDFYLVAFNTLKSSSFLAHLFIVFFFIMALLLLKRYITDPVNYVQEVINQIRINKKPIHIQLNRDDEIGLLAHSFNDLALEIDQYNRSLMKMSITDDITMLYNHRHFNSILEQRIEASSPFILAFLEVNFIKSYNNLFSRSQTDDVIREVSKLLQDSLRDEDLPFRIGNDTFSILFNTTNIELVLDYVRDFQNKVASLSFLGKDRLPTDLVSVSAGVTPFPEEARTKDILIKLTDYKLHNAKHFLQQRIGSYYSIFHEANQEEYNSFEDIYPLIKTLLSVIHAMDQYTLFHSEGVAKYSLDIGIALGLSKDELEILKYGALIHDVGKIEVGRKLLNQIEPLCDEDFQLIKQHPDFGVNIITSLERLSPLIPIVKYHHEWFNGRGYPEGLQGEAIPLLSRIVSVADAYDSMTTNRPYRMNTRTKDEAIAELVRCRGTQFDPAIVDIFINIITEK